MAKKEGYVESKGRSGLSPWVGWGISTLLLFFLNRHSDSSSTSSQQPSKYTEDNVNCIGQPVPVVLGRAMIKNPLVSYYGDFDNEPYTEEYGMHSGLDAAGLLWPFLLNILVALLIPSEHPTKDTDSHGDAGYGSATDTDNSRKFDMLVSALLSLLISLLLYLFTQHLGRTTIQKGFLYYLGWQHIICWTGKNIGIKKLWMNVYDSEIEESTETGVWDNNGHIAWEKDNINGIEAYIDDKEMFGGYDEQGGFTGSVRFYFGNHEQPKDAWMIHSMNQDTIEESLRGLTPKYPMYLTCVVSNSSKDGGAYIGKQATIPEMWFEVVNYPSRLYDNNKDIVLRKFLSALNSAYKQVEDYISEQDSTVQLYMKDSIEQLKDSVDTYNEAVDLYLEDMESNPFPSQELLDDIKNKSDLAYEAFPITNREEFAMKLKDLNDLCINGSWHLGQLGEDLNPAEAIYEILMNKYWGCGYVEDRVDVGSLIDLGVVCEQEKLGVSCLINRTAQANDYVSKILSHINGVKYDDPKTGKLTFKLIRNDYDINTIKVFDTSNTESCEFSRLDWSETTSAVEVTFTDASNKYDTGQFTFNDIANRLITGFYTSKSVEGEYFTTTANAMWLAKLTQLSNGYPLSAVNLVTNRYAYDVTIGDPIKVSWEPYGLSQIVYRVTDIDYSNLTDGKISITAIEDVFGFDKLLFEEPEAPKWQDPTDIPVSIGRYMFLEEPYESTRSLDSFIFAYAARPSNYDVRWNVWREVEGVFINSSQSVLWSTVGRLSFGYIKGFEFDEEGFEFSTVGVDGEERIEEKILKIKTYPNTYTVTSGLNLVIIDREWLSYSNIVKLDNGNYKATGVIRGIFDTLPEQHTAESIIYFVENRQSVAGVGNPVAFEGDSLREEKLELRTETRNVVQQFDPTLVETYNITRRAESPSIMANLKYCADFGELSKYEYDYSSSTIFSGNLLFNFICRNKFNNYGIISQVDTDTTITVAKDTRNIIQIVSNAVQHEWEYNSYDEDTETNVDNMVLKWEDFCLAMGDSLRYINSVTINILTYDSTRKLYSYDKYKKHIDYRIPRLVGIVINQEEAQNLANNYISEDGTRVIIPESSVNPQIGLLLTECPIFIEGVLVTGTSSQSDIMGQDGNMYRLSNTAYKVVGKDEDGNAILYTFEIDNNYVIRSDFNVLVGNYDEYWKRADNNWIKFNIDKT